MSIADYLSEFFDSDQGAPVRQWHHRHGADPYSRALPMCCCINTGAMSRMIGSGDARGGMGAVSKALGSAFNHSAARSSPMPDGAHKSATA
jgi:hypothetical protein